VGAALRASDVAKVRRCREGHRLAVWRCRKRRGAAHPCDELLVEDCGAGAARNRDRGHVAATTEAERDRARALALAARGGRILLVARQMRHYPPLVTRIRRNGLRPAAAPSRARRPVRTRRLIVWFLFLLLSLLLRRLLRLRLVRLHLVRLLAPRPAPRRPVGRPRARRRGRRLRLPRLDHRDLRARIGLLFGRRLPSDTSWRFLDRLLPDDLGLFFLGRELTHLGGALRLGLERLLFGRPGFRRRGRPPRLSRGPLRARPPGCPPPHPTASPPPPQPPQPL